MSISKIPSVSIGHSYRGVLQNTVKGFHEMADESCEEALVVVERSLVVLAKKE
jgi:hypothetical protein